MTPNDHEDTTPSDGVEDDLPGTEPDDLPGLEPDDVPGTEPDPPTEPAEELVEADLPGLTEADLDEWFESDPPDGFGGHERFAELFLNSDGELWLPALNDNLEFGVLAYGNELPAEAQIITGGRDRPWRYLGLEAKERFRRGYEEQYQAKPEEEVSQAKPEELAVDGSAIESAIPELSPLYPEKHPFRWIFVVGGFGVLGLVLAVGFFVFDGSDSSDTDASPPLTGEVAAQDGEESASAGAVAEPDPQVAVADEPQTAVEDEPTVAVEDEPAVAVVADVTASAFPARWDFTATKTATIVPAPDFITATPIGAVLPWSVTVTESCNGDACTYSSVIQPLLPEVVEGEVPEATWVVDGPEWSLDVTWAVAGCIEHRWTYRFTVTEAELIEGRSVATAFVGTWVQADSGDCLGSWELVDEWSVVGTAAVSG